MIVRSRIVIRFHVALLLLLALAGAARVAQAQAPTSRQLAADLERLEVSVRSTLGATEDPVRGRIVSAIVRGPVSADALRAMGVEVGTQVGDITTVRLPMSAAAQVSRLPGVEGIRLALPYTLHHDLSIPDARANNKRTQSPPLAGFNGNNVVIGLIDSGIDYQHDDFKNPDGTTRLLSIWDQTTGGTAPIPYNYGNECLQAQIQAGTCGEFDGLGHGTHVTGSAAGDGSATGNGVPAYKYAGMANKAAIIMVKTKFTDPALLDAVSYIFAKAAALGRPAVVNMSLGTNLGPHDGTLDLELGLNALVGPGKIIVGSAGNEATQKEHGKLVSTSALDSLTFAVPAYAGSASDDYFLLDGWYKGSDNYTVTLTSPTGIVFGPLSRGSFLNGANTTDGRVYMENGAIGTNNGDVNVYIEVSDLTGAPRPKAGGWRLRVNPVSVASSGQVHFWSFSSLSPTYPTATFATKFDSDVTVTAPSTADSLICVGAHTTKGSWTSSAPGQPGPWAFSPAEVVDQLCSFSSNGPRRDGVMKPDLTAPGSAVASALSTSWVAGGAGAGWDPVLAVDDGKHAVLQGTSMAAPHVTGAIAMMLQQNPNLNPTQARSMLTSKTRRDSPVTSAGAVPNKKFGWGKLDLTNVVPNVDTVAPTITVTRPNGGETFIIGSQDTIRWTANDNVMVTAIDLEYSSDNGLNWNPVVSGLTNSGKYLWIVPNTPTSQAKVRATAHDTQNQSQDASNAVFTVNAGVVDVSGAPLAFAVRPASPSPFSATTAIGFDLPPVSLAGQVAWPTRVRVFNVAGRLVRTAVEAALAPGPHVAAWDGRDEKGFLQPAGVYFIEVATSSQRGVVRAVFLR
ncbi:MAG: S8 family serine peptidase [Candidatus Eisenbacteria bacterium]